MARPAQPARPIPAAQAHAVQQRYAAERRRQLWVLWAVALLVLVAAVFSTGIHNVFLPGWWRVDLP